MKVQKELEVEESPRSVLRGRKSQTQNQTGIHWLRISMPRQYLKHVRTYCSRYFGEASQDGYGLWSYDTRFVWPNGASLNFDLEAERSLSVHRGKVTLDVPGKPLDTIAPANLHLFLVGLRFFNPVCTRIDVFFDDYQRLMTPAGLNKIAKKGDHSHFQKFQFRQVGRSKNGGFVLEHSEIDFGSRGKNGSGKYLRVYDKNLESKGEKDCIRWEIEFCKERAHKVFDELSQTTTLDDFAAKCGSYIGGSVLFVHRNGDKNICRLAIYEFWVQIQESLGSLVVRIEKKVSNISDMYRWVRNQVSATLATLRFTFLDDIDFMNLLYDIMAEGDLKMSQRQRILAKANKRTIRYSDGKFYNSKGFLVT